MYYIFILIHYSNPVNNERKCFDAFQKNVLHGFSNNEFCAKIKKRGLSTSL